VRAGSSEPDERATASAAGWVTEGLRFTCQRCGRCCTGAPGRVWLDDTELAALAELFGLSQRRFQKRYCRLVEERWVLRERKTTRGRDCVFLTFDEDGLAGCSVYAVRPAQCRTYPFWPSVLDSVRRWAEEGRSCRGIRAGLAGEGALVPADEVVWRCSASPGF